MIQLTSNCFLWCFSDFSEFRWWRIHLFSFSSPPPYCHRQTNRSAKLESLDLLKQLSKMDRKAELERKKAKLQALRDEKDRRRREKEQKDLEDAKTGAAVQEKDQRKWVTGRFDESMRFMLTLISFRDLDEMLSSLGVAPVSEVLSSLSSVNSVTSDQSANHTPDASLQPLNGVGWVSLTRCSLWSLNQQ